MLVCNIETRKNCHVIYHNFYVSGYKKDFWISVDLISGARLQTLTMDGNPKVCPSQSDDAFFFGRTGKSFYGFYLIDVFSVATQDVELTKTVCDKHSRIVHLA